MEDTITSSNLLGSSGKVGVPGVAQTQTRTHNRCKAFTHTSTHGTYSFTHSGCINRNKDANALFTSFACNTLTQIVHSLSGLGTTN